jgi:hypothetical protein
MRIVAVLLASATALIGATACSDAVANSTAAWVEVTPNSVASGSAVTIRANCVENGQPASVMSIAFGTITLQPTNGLLSGQALVPPNKEGGTYDVRLSCPSGSSANSTVVVLDAGPTATTAADSSTLGPNTGGGFLATGGSGDPVNRGPLVWLGIGLASLIAAVGLTVRSKLRGQRGDSVSAGDR